MVHLLEESQEPKKRKVRFRKFSGKFGVTFELWRKSFFIGFVVADIEEEVVVKTKKVKLKKGSAMFFPN